MVRPPLLVQHPAEQPLARVYPVSRGERSLRGCLGGCLSADPDVEPKGGVAGIVPLSQPRAPPGGGYGEVGRQGLNEAQLAAGRAIKPANRCAVAAWKRVTSPYGRATSMAPSRPPTIARAISLGEPTLIHGWDIARASDQQIGMDALRAAAGACTTAAGLEADGGVPRRATAPAALSGACSCGRGR
jgi:hypothetical protein